MNKFSCNVCMDLIPLVKDGIASEDSTALVKEHIKTCEHCASAFGNTIEVAPPMDEGFVLRKIKKQLLLIIVSIMFVGTLIGMILSDGTGIFYNALILPMIGILGYMVLQKKAYLVLIALYLFSFVWVTVREIMNGFLTSQDSIKLIIMSATWSLIFAFFIALGILIAGLLHFAFKKGEQDGSEI